MDLEMVLNELSLEPPAVTKQIARQRMTDFLGTVRIAIKFGSKRILRTSTDLHHVSLAPNYLLSQWRNDPEVDRETSQFFRSLVTKVPYLQDITDEAIEERSDRSQFMYQDREAKGLGIAYLLEALAVSLRTSPEWERDKVELTLI